MNGTVHALAPLHPLIGKPDRMAVEAAIRTIIRWAGDDPTRQGLLETPARVVHALEEYFAGYGEDPASMLRKSFDEIEGYDEMVVLRDVAFESHCEHHMAPILGRAWVAYVPCDGWSASASRRVSCRHLPDACRLRKSSPPRSPIRY